MAAPDLVDPSGLMEEAKRFAFVRQHRWPDDVHCLWCGRPSVVRGGGTVQRHAAGFAAVSVQGLWVPLGRNHRHSAGRASSAFAYVTFVPPSWSLIS